MLATKSVLCFNIQPFECMQKRQSLRNLFIMQKQIQDTHGRRLAVEICLPQSTKWFSGLYKGLSLTQCMLVTDNYFIIKHRLHLKSLPSNSLLWYTLEQNEKEEKVDTSVTIQVLFIHNMSVIFFYFISHINYIKCEINF